MSESDSCATYHWWKRASPAPARARSFRIRERTEADILHCVAMARALGIAGSTDGTLGIGMERLRRDLRRRCRDAGLDPSRIIEADELERAARARGERPRSETRRLDPDDGWRGRVGGYGPVID